MNSQGVAYQVRASEALGKTNSQGVAYQVRASEDLCESIMGVSLSRSSLVVDMSILMLLLCAICDVGWSLVGLTIVLCGLVSAAVVSLPSPSEAS